MSPPFGRTPASLPFLSFGFCFTKTRQIILNLTGFLLLSAGSISNSQFQTNVSSTTKTYQIRDNLTGFLPISPWLVSNAQFW
jgi:hypothetical protein